MIVSRPVVSAVIPHWRGKDILVRCLRSLKSITYRPLELLLVDNGSSDGSVQQAVRECPEVVVLSPGKNKGYAGGSNHGLREVKGEYALLLNDDAEVTPGFLEPLVEMMESDTAIAACQPKICSIRHPDRFDYAGAAGGYLDQYGFPFCRGRIFLTVEQDKGQYEDCREIFWASGACCLLRMESLRKVGLLDEEFFAHMEEIDLQWRLQLAGYRSMVVPSSVVLHDAGTTLNPETPYKVYLNHRNSLIMLLKNHRPATLFRVIPVRLVLDLLALLYRLARGEMLNAFAIFRALGYILFNLPSILERRPHLHALGTVSEAGVERSFYHRSIVWDYFVLHRRTFQQLSGFKGRG